MVFTTASTQASSIHPAFEIGWQCPLEIDLPAGIIKVVVVKMDRPVFVQGVLEVGFLSTPVIARHSAGGHIDGLTMQTMRRSVDYILRGNLSRKIPGGDKRVTKGKRRRSALEGYQLFPTQRSLEHTWAVNLAIEMSANDRLGRLAWRTIGSGLPQSSQHEIGLSRLYRPELGRCRLTRPGLIVWPRSHRFLIHRYRRTLRVKRRSYKIPLGRSERRIHTDLLPATFGVTHPQC